MAISISRIGERAKKVVQIDRLLENVGVLSAALKPSKPSADETRKTRFDADESVPIAARLAAWWNGDVISRRQAAKQDTKPVEQIVVDMDRWTGDRIKLVQEIWGSGFLEPGGAPTARKLLTPVMPNSKQSVLDLTTGLGGTAFTLAQDQNLWMDAFEPDAELASEALRAATKSGLGGQVPVEQVSIDKINITQNKYHLIYSRERLFAIPDKLEILKAAAAGLKSGGSLVITDLLVGNSEDLESDDFQSWIESEPGTPQPWTMALYVKALEDAGLKVVSRQNMSQDYLTDIYAGWQKTTDMLESGEFKRDLDAYLLAEGDLWMARTRALEAGVIMCCRIIARQD